MRHELCYIICPVILYALFLRPAQVTSWPMGVSPAGSVGYRLRGVAGTEACASDTIIAPSWRCRCCCRQRRRRRRRRHRHCCGFGMNYKKNETEEKKKTSDNNKNEYNKTRIQYTKPPFIPLPAFANTHTYTNICTWIHEHTHVHTLIHT